MKTLQPSVLSSSHQRHDTSYSEKHETLDCTVSPPNSVVRKLRPLRITEIVNTLEIGGLERMVVDLVLALRSRGHFLDVICLRQAGAFAGMLREAGVEVTALGKADGFNLHSLRRMASHLREKRIDVVHTHNPLVHHYGALAGRLARVPAVVNTRHGLGNFPRTRWNETKTEAIFGLSGYLTDRVVAVCSTARDYFQRHAYVATRKLTVIVNGVQLQRFAHIQPPAPGLTTVFGTVGRLVPVKDHRTLLEAFALAVRRNPNCRLEILGDGPLRQHLWDLTRQLGICEAVSFHGTGLDVPRFLSRLHVFVLSSMSEGMPLTVLEAMASGLPVIATAVGGIQEIVQQDQTGWLCPPSNPPILAETMLTAAASQQRIVMGDRGRQHVMSKLSIAQMADEYERLFGRVLALRNKRS